MQSETKIAIFKGRKIRKILYQNEWWFSVVDVIESLTDSVNPRDYWYKMKIRKAYRNLNQTQMQAAVLPVTRAKPWKNA